MTNSENSAYNLKKQAGHVLLAFQLTACLFLMRMLSDFLSNTVHSAKKILIAIFVIFIISVQNATTVSSQAHDKNDDFKSDFLEIKFSLDTRKNSNPKKNRLVWSTRENSYKDFFDAVSGASSKHSTLNLRSVFFTSEDAKEKILPKGLYALLLFAVTSPDSIEKDSLTVTRSKTEKHKLEISFIHRENSYRITTDKNGMLNISESFFLHEKNSPSDELENEAKSYFGKDDSIYKGKLKTSFSKKGILKIRGKLQKVQKPSVTEKSDSEPSEEHGKEPAHLQHKEDMQGDKKPDNEFLE